MKKILVVDDHEIIYEGIVSLLRKFLPEITVEGISNMEKIDEVLSNDEFSLIILDINIPNGNSLGFVDKLSKGGSGIPILIFSALEEKTLAQSFFEAGAKGYIQKNVPHSEILTAIKTVLAGNVYMGKALADLLLNRSLEYAFGQNKKVESLTIKEVEILTLLRDGKQIKEMIDITGMSISTIYLHKKNIFTKLNVKDDMELARIIEKFF